MKQTQLQLTSNGKTVGSIDLDPDLQFRLQAFAKVNKVGLLKLITLALRNFTEGDSYSGPGVDGPEEEDLVAVGAKTLTKAAA